MIPLHTDIKSFVEKIEKNIPITFSKNGWKESSGFSKCFRASDQKNSKLACSYIISAMDKLERCPVEFSANGKALNEKVYSDFIYAAKIVELKLKQSGSNTNQQLTALAVRVAALKYRIEAVNGGLNPSPQAALKEQVTAAAILWKNKEKFYKDSNLSNREQLKIEEVCAYPEYAKLILENTHLANEFFKWALRDNNGVDQLVQFPAICERLKTCYVAARIGKFGGKDLKIEKVKVKENPELSQKVLKLPFFNGILKRRISILDETKIVNLSGWKLSIKKIFDLFAAKNNVVTTKSRIKAINVRKGLVHIFKSLHKILTTPNENLQDVEFFGVNGIMNWNSKKIGVWDTATQKLSSIDFNDPNWIDKLPVNEIKTKEEIQNFYGVELAKDNCLFVYRAARKVGDLSPGERHSFLEVVLPQNGKYTVYSFGVYPIHFSDSVTAIDSTRLAEISYPDENIFLPRQQAMAPMQVTKEEMSILLESIGQDLQKVQNKCFIFQTRWENCSYWVQKTGEKIDNKTNPYKMELAKSTTFAAIDKFPRKYHKAVVSVLDFLLGSWRGLNVVENGKTAFKSVSQIPDCDRQYFYQPGWLHEQIIAGALKGRVFFGY